MSLINIVINSRALNTMEGETADEPQLTFSASAPIYKRRRAKGPLFTTSELTKDLPVQNTITFAVNNNSRTF